MKTLYEGKTKKVLKDEKDNSVYIFFKDSATGENGVFDPGSNTVGGIVEGKGKIGLIISKYFLSSWRKRHTHPLPWSGYRKWADESKKSYCTKVGICTPLFYCRQYVPKIQLR